MDLLKHLEKYLVAHTYPALPFLLGLSGGEDSMCLFHLLSCLKAKFACVYVDHRWREESVQEASLLEGMCSERGIPFHLAKVDYSFRRKNMEEHCRDERLKIFHELVLAHGYQGVMLAHQAQDQAETVLKRVFEGSSIAHLKSMEKISFYGSMPLFRPLLSVSKKEIRDYVKRHQIDHFTDKTNSDEKYLRARMRLSLFPKIAELFGKEITDPLLRIAEEAAVISDFLDQQTDHLFRLGRLCSLGYCLDLSQERMHLAQAMHLIGRVGKELKLTLSRTQKEDAAKAVVDGRANLSFEIEGKTLEVDRRRIFLLKSKELAPDDFEDISPSSYSLVIKELAAISEKPEQRYSGWQCLFMSGGVLRVPADGKLRMKRIKPGELFPGNSPIAKFWTKRKVPACLRPYLPGIYQGERLIADLATGEVRCEEGGTAQKLLHISLEIVSKPT